MTVLWYEGKGGVGKRMVWGGGLCEEECGTGGGRVVWVWGGGLLWGGGRGLSSPIHCPEKTSGALNEYHRSFYMGFTDRFI